eukprot:7625718-Pyramimonas_sp.AAC.1
MRRLTCAFEAPPPVEARSDYHLQRLYGRDVYPPDLCDFFNKGVGIWQRACLAGTSEADVKGRAFSLLYHDLRVEATPVVTRFFLFASCACGLSRCRLLGHPATFSRRWRRSP